MRLHPSPPSAETAETSQPSAPVARRRGSTLRRRLLWIAGTALVLLLLVLTPPLVNANRYRTRIADTMSASLGRPVHLDDVSFHILPVPGFTLNNLVVSEDPAFGAEPTIRANTVEATLRVSSLWHRPVEFSTVRFLNPSVNLVRNADGRWNLSDVLLHASRVSSAPTAQRHAGPAPRFPYIEATSGRVNVKLGVEKLPFSLTETDFALWLPSPQQWRVRLVGHPARTDTNITDPGTVRLEGELRRADAATAVPVNFTASWHNAPLGEASRILTGDDRGWRGTLNLDATLAGTLGDAHFASKLTLGGLRRAEFFPTQPLDLQITCGSGFQLHPAVLAQLRCTLPDEAPEPLTLTSASFDPQRPEQGELAIEGADIPARWALLWASLFSARVPTDLLASGTLSVHVVHGPLAVVPAAAPARSRRGATAERRRAHSPAAVAALGGVSWGGTIDMSLPAAGQVAPTAAGEAPADAPNRLTWQLGSIPAGGWPVLSLAPTQVKLGPGAQVTVSASVAHTGYTLNVNGNAPAAALLLPARYLPQLGDGLEQVLPFPPTSTDPLHVVFTCDKSWSTPQTCTGAGQAPGARPVVNSVALPGPRPSSLTSPNLSPLERAPFSTPRPTATSAPPR